MEDTLKLIREREDYLVKLNEKENKELYVSYYRAYGCIGGGYCHVFTLSDDEIEYLKISCIKEIKRLRQSIECLTDENTN